MPPAADSAVAAPAVNPSRLQVGCQGVACLPVESSSHSTNRMQQHGLANKKRGSRIMIVQCMLTGPQADCERTFLLAFGVLYGKSSVCTSVLKDANFIVFMEKRT